MHQFIPSTPIKPSMNRRLHPVTLQQAAQASPTLARLAELARDSGERLKAVELPLIPAAASRHQAGPHRRHHWCLLVTAMPQLPSCGRCCYLHL
jgi:hypothetical protein